MQDTKSLGEYINKEAGSLPKLVLGILPISLADIYLAIRQFGDVHVSVSTLTCSIIRTILMSCVGTDAMCRKSCRGVRHALEKPVSALFIMVIGTYLF